VAAGEISPEIIVEMAPFLDKETLTEIIRKGMGNAQSKE
jgi:hypothetical protein